MRVNKSHPQDKANAVPPRRSVYLGQSRVGDIQQQDREYLARDRQGRPLGLFSSLAAAANAISSAAGEL
jgi:hypothetical protein